MQGTLIRYGPKPACVAFVSGPKPELSTDVQKTALVAVGGLSCGFLFADYLVDLKRELESIGVYLCQPLMSSSHTGWGTGSVSRDAEELDVLLEHLCSRHGFSEFILLGHSTGCQDAVMYMRKFGGHGRRFRVSRVVLQAPVSDREFLRWFLADVQEKLARCREMEREGRADEIALMFRWEEGGDAIPVTARRFISLADVGGEDDMFSSTELDLNQALSSLRDVPTLVLVSGADECQVPYTDPAACGRQLVHAIGASAELEVIEGGLHDLKGKETSERAALLIRDFTNRNRGRCQILP